MPKLKTRKSLIKRFKITGKGKVIHGHQYARHRRFHKSKRRIRSFSRPTLLSTKQAKRVKSFIA
ncbi:50S ribosomal protein L35 [Candidatus Gottesmanbacteria bacterium]|nr:50S ribosomal protein L35 [Candidatus Gottesmanbacteria bacterium]